LLRYVSALTAAVVAALVQYALLSELGIAPFVLFYVAVALCAGLAGRGPGLLCVLASALLGNWFFLRPHGSWGRSPAALAAMALFLLGGTLIVLACSSFRVSLLRMESTVRELDEEAAERRRAEARLRGIYELGVTGVLYFTVDGRVLNANDKFLSMTGYTREDLESGSVDWIRMTPAEWDAVDERALSDFQTRGISPPFEKELIRKDGSRMPVIFGGAMLDAQRAEGIAFIVDISEQKLAERALNESREALRLSDQHKSEFLGALSHEVRNPLAAIRTGLWVLGRTEPGGERAQRVMAVIERQTEQLTRLTDDLLDLTRVSRGKIRLRPEPLDLNEVVLSTAEDHREMFEDSGVELQVVTEVRPVRLFADPTRVKQMIGNLLHNAAKFTPRGGKAVVSLGRADRDAVLMVRDTGVGISAEALPHLFEPFVQCERTVDRSAGGLGLGLALVKGLAEQHGGGISVHSDGVGQGTTFVLRLPLDRRRVPRVSLVPGAPGRIGRRVLIIEDNKDGAEMMREALEMEDHLVQVAHDGTEGIEKARSFQPDLILCDIGLPGVDGYQVARAIRADGALRSVRLIALSGYGQPADVERSREAGFDLHVTKPVDLEDLGARIGRLDAAAAE